MIDLKSLEYLQEQTSFKFSLENIRIYRVSKEHIAKVPRNYYKFNQLDEDYKRKKLLDLENELLIGKIANDLRLRVPIYEDIKKIVMVDPKTKEITEAPALIMKYVPGVPASLLRKKRQLEEEKKSFNEAIEQISFYFNPLDAYAARNRIWNPIQKQTTIVDLELWKQL